MRCVKALKGSGSGVTPAAARAVHAMPRCVGNGAPRRRIATVSMDRRSLTLSIAALAMLFGGEAQARDAQAAMKAKEERKRALRAAAEEMRESGIGESAFQDSEYSVSEDKTPNIHTRQEEGKRSQVNA